MIKRIMLIVFVGMLANTFTVYAEGGDQPPTSAQSTGAPADLQGTKTQGGFSPPVKPLTDEQAAQQEEGDADEEEEKLMVREVC